MKLSDLKPGHHAVKTRSGNIYFVAYSEYWDCPFLISEKAYNHLDRYRENFRNIEFANLDIVAVYQLSDGSLLNQKCIWEESDKQELQAKIDSARNMIDKYKRRLLDEEKNLESLVSMLKE